MKKNQTETIVVEETESPKRIRKFLARSVKTTAMVIGATVVGYALATVRQKDSA